MEWVREGAVTLSAISNNLSIQHLMSALVIIVGIILTGGKEGSRSMVSYMKMYCVFFCLFCAVGSAEEFPYNEPIESVCDKYFEYSTRNIVNDTQYGAFFHYTEEDKDIYSIDSFIEYCEMSGHKPSRNELIQKMLTHKKEYNYHLAESKKILSKVGLLNTDLRELYQAAETMIVTHAGGTNFIRSFVLTIIQYIFNKGYETMSLWNDYKTHIYQCDHHAEMFDFYMKVLKQLYGQ